MVLGGCPVSYLLLCGQAALLLGNLLLLHCVSRSHSQNTTYEPELTSSGAAHPEGSAGTRSWEYGDPHSPVILCSYLPDEFIDCEDPVDHVGNTTAFQELGYGCLKGLYQATLLLGHVVPLFPIISGSTLLLLRVVVPFYSSTNSIRGASLNTLSGICCFLLF
ncbi:TM2 domain-containing protein 2 [Echinops telfairi]|uniref:TM2 domain-containing protein 2 n=1 Tax=Echinops telfairi TaxID=9371 RepID=A0AC55CT47_ECHTE|nr:TM2 domain-containing protein 2 [Echinops telfairi]